jgi:hypothetical protein
LAESGGHPGRDGEAAMATNRTPLQRSGRLRLSHEEALSLRYGDLPGRPAFASEEQRREAWFYHRDRLLQHCSGGQRPAGWWNYESPIPYPGRDYAEAALYEAKLLTESEVAELTARWRSDFERAQEPGFARCMGFARPGDTTATWLRGKAARRAFYRWSGVPRDLLKRWTRERRQRKRRIQELKATAARCPVPAA